MRIRSIPEILLSWIFLLIYTCINTKAQNNSKVSLRESVIITGTGDIMLGTSFPSPKFLPPGNNSYVLMENIADSLRDSDITFGNLEGAFLDEGEPFKKCRDTTICYLFRMPEKYASALAYAGFDIISLANNHFGDFGLPAARSTMKLLDSLNIYYAGPEEVPYTIFVRDSVTYGFCAFSYNTGTMNINDLKMAEEIARMLDCKCDIVIVSFHGGAEGADYQRVPEGTEYFYGENRGNIRQFARRMVEAGADVVFGHGPHVTRAVEIYRDRIICYSLGNFCTYGRFNLTGPNGIAPIIKVKTDLTGKFISGTIIPVCQEAGGVPRYDTLKRAITKIRELTLLDFPDTGPEITDDGKILKR
ncbi:MAG: CapA family protein [Bacteroidales bacterium]